MIGRELVKPCHCHGSSLLLINFQFFFERSEIGGILGVKVQSDGGDGNKADMSSADKAAVSVVIVYVCVLQPHCTAVK